MKTSRRTRAVAACFLAAFSGASAAVEVVACTTADTELRVDREAGRVESVQHRPSKAAWVHTPFPFFRVAEMGDVRAGLDVQATADGILLTLQIVNVTTGPRTVVPVFPDLQLKGADAAGLRWLRYCFSARSALVRGENRKAFELSKTDSDLPLSTRYEPRTLAPSEAWRLPPVLLATTNGTWHSGLTTYRNWLKTWCRPVVPRNASFRAVFNFRTCYLLHVSACSRLAGLPGGDLGTCRE